MSHPKDHTVAAKYPDDPFVGVDPTMLFPIFSSMKGGDKKEDPKVKMLEAQLAQREAQYARNRAIFGTVGVAALGLGFVGLIYLLTTKK